MGINEDRQKQWDAIQMLGKKVICKHRTIRDWPSCFEDCVYANEPACPHYQQACVPVSSKPEELIEGLAELQEFEDYKIAVQSHYYLTTPVWQVEDAKFNLIKLILNYLSSHGFGDIEQTKKEEKERIIKEIEVTVSQSIPREVLPDLWFAWYRNSLRNRLEALKQEGK